MKTLLSIIIGISFIAGIIAFPMIFIGALVVYLVGGTLFLQYKRRAK